MPEIAREVTFMDYACKNSLAKDYSGKDPPTTKSGGKAIEGRNRVEAKKSELILSSRFSWNL